MRCGCYERDFPNDPEVLYITTHYFSELATRASQELAAVAPTSYQAHELEAEAMESQEKWDEAAVQYTKDSAAKPERPWDSLPARPRRTFETGSLPRIPKRRREGI